MRPIFSAPVNKRNAAVALVVVLAIAMTGCTSRREPPPGPSAAETRARLQARVDLAWKNTGMTTGRPEIDSPAEPATQAEFSECMAAAGIDSWSVSEDVDGPTFGDVSGQARSDIQMVFYTCFAQHPLDAWMGEVVLSDDQRNYLYDYYRSWLIPCLALHTADTVGVPSRKQFLSAAWLGWDPYESAPSLRSTRLREGMERNCGGKYADLDVIDPYVF